MIGKHVVIDTLDNFKAKLDLIPSSAIVLIKDVGQIYAHGTYFGAQKTYSLLTKTADGLAPQGGTSASSLISNVDTEWVLTVTNGENPTWRKLPANAFNSSSYTLSSATTSDLGGIKVGQVYTATFDDLVGQYYKINVDKNGLAYVHVPWVNNPYTASGSGITLKDNVFSLSLNSVTKLDLAIGNKIYAVSLDKNGKLCVSVPWTDTNNIFVGATETINGSSGMVPAPIANQHRYFLRGDGTWVKPNLSDLNDDIVNGKYLPLSGGTLTGSTADILTIKRTSEESVSVISFATSNGTVGRIGYDDGGIPYATAGGIYREIIHEGNYKTYALPITGGSIKSSDIGLHIKRTGAHPKIAFYMDETLKGYIGYNADGNPIIHKTSGDEQTIYHSGNFNPSDYLPLTGGTLTGTLTVNSDLGVGGLIVNRGHYLFARDNANADWIVTNKNWLDEYKLWHSGNDGSDSGLDADLLDGKEGSWYIRNVLNFQEVKGTYTSGGYDLNVLNYGLVENYASSSYWANAPVGFSYGMVLNLKTSSSNSLLGQLAWDINHRGTDSTRYLYWRANDDTDLANAKWHQIAFTDTKVQNASNADVATKLGRAEYLKSDEAIDGFLEANRFKFAMFKTEAQNQIGFASNDGMLLSIPWGDTGYGFQMAFDDSTNCTIKARGKAGSWGTWRTLYHTGNLTKVSQLTNDSGYLTSRGYVGTTAVLASSASLDLTGIGWINGGIRLNKANDDCGRMQGLGHGLEFGGPGYAHMNYYFRPHYGTSGSTLTNVYIQNASAGSAPTFTTTHSFSSAGNAYHSGTVTSTGFIKSGSSNSYVLLGGGGHKTESSLSVSYAASAGNADTLDNYHASSLVKFYLSPLSTDAPAASAKTWFTDTMPSKSGAIVYNVPGSEKTIIVGKSSGAFGHMLQLNYDDTYLRILRYFNGSWKSTDWEKISAGYADSAGYAAKSNVIALTAAAEDACVPSGFDTMQHYRVSSSTTGGADGYIQAYVWNSGKYATQIYYDVDPTNIMALRHRKNEGTWTSWMQICKSSTIRTLTVTSSPGSDANTIYFVT